MNSYIYLSDDDELLDWRKNTISKILAIAEQKPSSEMGVPGFTSNRAYCPLCGRSASTIYGSEGFAFPQGLVTHLNGKSHIRPCPVFNAAVSLWKKQFNKVFVINNLVKGEK